MNKIWITIFQTLSEWIPGAEVDRGENTWEILKVSGKWCLFTLLELDAGHDWLRFEQGLIRLHHITLFSRLASWDWDVGPLWWRDSSFCHTYPGHIWQMVYEVKPETLWYFILLLIFKDIDEIGHYLTMTEHDKAQNVYKFHSCTDLDETEIHVMFWR